MLWDLIRDWFVKYIFGGVDSQGFNFPVSVGSFFDENNGNYPVANLSNGNQFFVPINGFVDEGDNIVSFINIGDWLSTTATIIVLCLLVSFLIFTTIYVFKWFAGLFKWR